MRTPPLLTSGLIACALLTNACASRPASAPLPLLTLPDVARQPCRLPVLPEAPTQADLDAAYLARGEAVAVCDGRRELAVQAFDAQQRAIQPPPRPWWARLLGD